MKVLDVKYGTSAYKARTWDREDAKRYIFEDGGIVFEAGFFVHYKDDIRTKLVIEFPVSSGCSVGCRHCASGAISRITQLRCEQTLTMLDHINSDNQVDNDESFLVTFSGTGELSLNTSETFRSIEKIATRHRNAYFSLATSAVRLNIIEKCQAMRKKFNIKHLQITYFHHDTRLVSQIIPSVSKYKYDIHAIVDEVKRCDDRFIKINYVTIRGLNDSVTCMDGFAHAFNSIRKNIVLRISTINSTEISVNNGLHSVNDGCLEALEHRALEYGFDAHIFTAAQNNTFNCGQLSWKKYANNTQEGA